MLGPATFENVRDGESGGGDITLTTCRLMGDDETATVRTRATYGELIAVVVGRHHGRVVDFTGDNLLAEFSSVVDAAAGAVEIQRELCARNTALPDQRKMRFRIGISLGDVLVEGDP